MRARPRRGSDRYDRMVEQERLILEATELIYELMEEKSVTKAELARRVGKTRGYLTQILSGRRNMTLRTLADLAFALGHRLEVESRVLASRRSATSTAHRDRENRLARRARGR